MPVERTRYHDQWKLGLRKTVQSCPEQPALVHGSFSDGEFKIMTLNDKEANTIKEPRRVRLIAPL